MGPITPRRLLIGAGVVLLVVLVALGGYLASGRSVDGARGAALRSAASQPVTVWSCTNCPFQKGLVPMGWKPVTTEAGYTFYRDGTKVSSSSNPQLSAATLSVSAGRHTLVVQTIPPTPPVTTTTTTTTPTATTSPTGWTVAPPQPPVHDLTNTSGVGLLLVNQPNTTWNDYSTTTGTSDSAVELGPETSGVTFNRFHIENAASVGAGPGYGRHGLYDKAANTTVNDWYVRCNSSAPDIGSAFSLRYHGFTANRFDIDCLWDVSFFDDDPGNVPGRADLTNGKAVFHASSAMLVDSQFQWDIHLTGVDFTGPTSSLMHIDSGSVPPKITLTNVTLNGHPVTAANFDGVTPASLTIDGVNALSSAPTPPTPPQPYTIPAGAIVIPDGTYNGLTVNGDVYAAHLGGVTVNGGVRFISGSLHGVVINGNIASCSGNAPSCAVDIAGNSSPATITDSWVHAGGADYGIYAYRPNGLDVERVVIDGFINVGLRASDNDLNSGAVIQRLWDLKITGGNQGGATGGRGEVALWVGAKVADGVQRVELSGAYITELETVAAARDTTFTDVKATNDVGADTAVYLEHQSTNLTFNRFDVTSEAGAYRTVQCEYVASFAVGACNTIRFDGGTVTGGHTGYDLEDAVNVTITNTKFVGQDSRGIFCLRCTGFSQTSNDFSGMAPGTPPVVTSP